MPGEKRDPDSRRRQILDTALAIASRDRLEGVTVRSVAREAGISMGLVSFHFGSKDGMLAALLEELVARIFAAGFQAEAASGAPGDRLLAAVENTLDLILDHSDDVQLLLDYWLRARHDPAIRAVIQDGLADYQRLVDGLAADLVASDPEAFAGVTPHGLAALAMSAIEGTMFQTVLFPGHLEKESYLGALRLLVLNARATTAG